MRLEYNHQKEGTKNARLDEIRKNLNEKIQNLEKKFQDND